MRQILMPWVMDAIEDRGGKATIVEVAQHIWRFHEEDLLGAGDLFFTWQYDMRWAAQQLRDDGKLLASNASPRGYWISTTREHSK